MPVNSPAVSLCTRCGAGRRWEGTTMLKLFSLVSYMFYTAKSTLSRHAAHARRWGGWGAGRGRSGMAEKDTPHGMAWRCIARRTRPTPRRSTRQAGALRKASSAPPFSCTPLDDCDAMSTSVLTRVPFARGIRPGRRRQVAAQAGTKRTPRRHMDRYRNRYLSQWKAEQELSKQNATRP
jgi:hypothetical protein